MKKKTKTDEGNDIYTVLSYGSVGRNWLVSGTDQHVAVSGPAAKEPIRQLQSPCRR